MKLFIPFLLFIVPFLIAIFTGRASLAILITMIIFISGFTIQNMGGGHFVEALQFALGLSMFVAIPCVLGAFFGLGVYFGFGLYTKSDAQIIEAKKQKEAANGQ